MKSGYRSICIMMIVCILAISGCQSTNQNVKKRPAIDPVNPAVQGRQMLLKVYDTLVSDYVEPVHPHRLIVGAAKAIQSEYVDDLLVQAVTGDVRVMSPVTRRVYNLEISADAGRQALVEIYTYGETTYAGGHSLQVAYVMANGMAECLDPHTSVLTPESLEEMKSNQSGKLTGIGVNITVKDNRVVVISPIDGSAADRAGLQPGDTILKVDGRPVNTLIGAVNAIRGQAGTIVTLTVQQSESAFPSDLRLVREDISIKSVRQAVIGGNIQYLRISQFGNDTANDFAALLRSPYESGTPIKGMVIDLRHNPGGLLNQSLTIADYFIPAGTLLKLKRRKAEQAQEFLAQVEDIVGNLPVVVLVDSGTASGAEIMAGALRGHARALLLGGTTFGKGSLQSLIDLPGGYGLKFTIGYYELPGGRRINKNGLQPDVVLYTKSDTLREKDLSDGTAAEKLKTGNSEGSRSFKQAKLWQGRLDPAALIDDSGIARAVDIITRTRSARLVDMLAADLSVEPKPAVTGAANESTWAATPPAKTNAPPTTIAKIRPRLFVLAIGVSRYSDPRLALGYAEKDADAIASVLGTQQSALFREVHTKVLLNENASRDSIIAAMNTFLGRAVSTDVVLIFVAGHGVKRAATDTFYFLPYDSNLHNMTTKGLRWSDFQEEVAVLGARVKNVILLIDTCHSGALEIGARGLGVIPDLSSAFDRKGTYALAASSADEIAMESDAWGHGAFTYALLQGLKRGADYSGDHTVDILELFHYVEAKVADMTAGQQHPRFQMGGGSLPVYTLPR